ncbi:MAG: hypothetical protein CMF55_04880, partial [Legionellales bacterium]|nr:hypothetical protein [Legionellales bacterium]
MTTLKKLFTVGLLSALSLTPLHALADSTSKTIITSTNNLIKLAIPYGITIALAIIIFVVGIIISKIVTNLLGKVLQKRKIELTISKFICRLLYAILMIFVVLATLSQLGVQTASLIAILGAMSLAVGLSLKSSLSNLASGLLMILFRPIKTGDLIQITNAEGTVDEINLLYTEVITPNNQLLIVPNSKFMNNIISNFSAKDVRRCELTIGIGYNDSVDAAKSVLHQILKEDKRIINQPKEPLIAVNALGDSSVDIIIQYWTQRTDFATVKRDVIETIKKRFDE